MTITVKHGHFFGNHEPGELEQKIIDLYEKGNLERETMMEVVTFLNHSDGLVFEYAGLGRQYTARTYSDVHFGFVLISKKGDAFTLHVEITEHSTGFFLSPVKNKDSDTPTDIGRGLLLEPVRLYAFTWPYRFETGPYHELLQQFLRTDHILPFLDKDLKKLSKLRNEYSKNHTRRVKGWPYLVNKFFAPAYNMVSEVYLPHVKGRRPTWKQVNAMSKAGLKI